MEILKIAATGMRAQQLNVQVIANNISNVNTSGYKRSRAEFSDLLYQTQERQGAFSSSAGTIVPVGVQVGLGVKPTAIARVSEQGALKPTDNPFDLAIDGPGYFVVRLPNSDLAYARAGNFQLSPEGQMVTADGFEVDPGVIIPPGASDVEINRSGEVFAFLEGENEPTLQGRLSLVTFVNEAGLFAMGDNLYRQTPASGEARLGLPGDNGFGLIRQGYLESSNVDVVAEITDLITAQRAYEMNARVIEAGDQMAQTVSNLR